MAVHNHLTIDDKNKLVQFILASSINGKPSQGKMKEAAELFGVHRKTVFSLWTASKKKMEQGRAGLLISSRLGVPHSNKIQLDEEKLKSIPFKERTTIRATAKEMNVSTSTVSRWLKERLIRPHTNAIKPTLTEKNKIARLQYCLSQLEHGGEENKIQFACMRNIIHIDEKWFYITQENDRCYKLPGEANPYRSCKSKRFITKVMFLCAVGRPHYANDGTLLFDGKIGMFPFIEQIPAKRNSKNRLKGTLETKNIESITKQVIKNCIISQVIPTLKSKWPAAASKDIFIQQDNAKPHITNNDQEFRQVASSDGFNIQLVCQPPNSPDTNVNDLGWFRSLQSLQQTKKAHNVDDLVKNVTDSFQELTVINLNKVFLSMQCCCIEIMKVKGHNNYEVPHMSKDKLIKEGILPDCLDVDVSLVTECIEYLRLPENELESIYDLGALLSHLGYA